MSPEEWFAAPASRPPADPSRVIATVDLSPGKVMLIASRFVVRLRATTAIRRGGADCQTMLTSKTW